MRRPIGMAAFVAALLVSGQTAAAARGPHLGIAQVEKLALHAAHPYADVRATVTEPLSVEQIQLAHNHSRLVWLAHMHAQQFVFPCGRPGVITYCVPSFATHALVRIDDATGRVLSVHPGG